MRLINQSEMNTKEIKRILNNEIKDEGMDNRDFFIKITKKKMFRRKGTCYGDIFRKVFVPTANGFSDKPYIYIVMHSKKHGSLEEFLQTFRHELKHARGIKHKDFLNYD